MRLNEIKDRPGATSARKRLGRGIGWLNQPGELISERDIGFTAFAAGSETGIEFRAGSACFRSFNDPL